MKQWRTPHHWTINKLLRTSWECRYLLNSASQGFEDWIGLELSSASSWSSSLESLEISQSSVPSFRDAPGWDHTDLGWSLEASLYISMYCALYYPAVNVSNDTLLHVGMSIIPPLQPPWGHQQEGPCPNTCIYAPFLKMGQVLQVHNSSMLT